MFISLGRLLLVVIRNPVCFECKSYYVDIVSLFDECIFEQIEVSEVSRNHKGKIFDVDPSQAGITFNMEYF